MVAFERSRFHRVDGGGNKNLPSWSVLLPLVQVGFIVSTAEAAKSCFRGEFAAFNSGGFHRVFGRGSKILLLRRDCCLWSWRVSSGLRQRQQNPAFAVCSAAFALGEFHRVFGGGSKILLPRRVCCLWSCCDSSGLRRRQQIHASLGYSAAFGHGSLGSKGRQPNEVRLGNL